MRLYWPRAAVPCSFTCSLEGVKAGLHWGTPRCEKSSLILVQARACQTRCENNQQKALIDVGTSQKNYFFDCQLSKQLQNLQKIWRNPFDLLVLQNKNKYLLFLILAKAFHIEFIIESEKKHLHNILYTSFMHSKHTVTIWAQKPEINEVFWLNLRFRAV